MGGGVVVGVECEIGIEFEDECIGVGCIVLWWYDLDLFVDWDWFELWLCELYLVLFFDFVYDELWCFGEVDFVCGCCE